MNISRTKDSYKISLQGRRLALGSSESDAMADAVRSREGSVLRLIAPEAVETICRLFSCGLVNQLTGAGLLTPSRLTELAGEVSEFAIEQPELLAPSHPTELPSSLRKDAALVLLQVALLLDREGFVLRDGDLSGMFVNRIGRPVFHNLGAIRPKGTCIFPYKEFHEACLAPIRLIDRNARFVDLVQRSGIVRIEEDLGIRHPWLMRAVDFVSGMGRTGNRFATLSYRLAVSSRFSGLLHSGLYFRLVREALAKKLGWGPMGNGSGADWTHTLLCRLKWMIERLDVSRVSQRWTNYYKGYDLPAILGATSDWRCHFRNDRAEALLTVLAQEAPGTLLDIGANQGYHSLLAAHLGFSVTAVDNDVGAVDRLYCLLKASGYPLPIRSVVLDFTKLREDDHWRFEADVVIALGFTHHMRLVELLPWSAIVEPLAGLTRRLLITEFKAGTKARGHKVEMTRTLQEDYSLDRFVEALKDRFRSVEVLGSYSAQMGHSLRTMLICRK